MNTKDRNKECCSVQQVEEYPKREVEFVFGSVTIRSGKLEKHTRSKVKERIQGLGCKLVIVVTITLYSTSFRHEKRNGLKLKYPERETQKIET